jgi:formate dehydrogenase subunit delta
MSPDEKLIYMANQIGKFFAAQGGEDVAVDGIATHLRKFWPAPMRTQIIAQLRQGAPGLDELPRRAVERLASGG